jgi:hypothetical protein
MLSFWERWEEMAIDFLNIFFAPLKRVDGGRADCRARITLSQSE